MTAIWKTLLSCLMYLLANSGWTADLGRQAQVVRQVEALPFLLRGTSIARSALGGIPVARLVFTDALNEPSASNGLVTPIVLRDPAVAAKILGVTGGDCTLIHKFKKECLEAQKGVELGNAESSPDLEAKQLAALEAVLNDIVLAAQSIPMPDGISAIEGTPETISLVKDGVVFADCRSGKITVPATALRDIVSAAAREGEGGARDWDENAESFPALAPKRANYALRLLPDVALPYFGTAEFAIELRKLPKVKLPTAIADDVNALAMDGRNRLQALAEGNARAMPMTFMHQGDDDPLGVEAFSASVVEGDSGSKVIDFLIHAGSQRTKELTDLSIVYKDLKKIMDSDGKIPGSDEDIDDVATRYLSIAGTSLLAGSLNVTFTAYRTLVFTLAHEYYHVHYDRCAPLLSNEVEADMFAVAVYTHIFGRLEMINSFPGIDQDTTPTQRIDSANEPNELQGLMMATTANYLRNLPKSGQLSSASNRLLQKTDDADFATSFTSLFGVHAMQTLLVIYSTNKFFEKDVTHAPVELRMQAAMRAYTNGADDINRSFWNAVTNGDATPPPKKKRH